MGLRGPLRDPNSRRGRKESVGRNVLAVMAPADGSPRVLPVCDPDLPERVRQIFADLVRWAAEAKLPLKQMDSVAFTGASRCVYAIERASTIMEDPDADAETRVSAMRLSASLERDLQKWLEMIGGTPGSRARIGIRAEPPKKEGPLARMLAARQRQISAG